MGVMGRCENMRGPTNGFRVYVGFPLKPPQKEFPSTSTQLEKPPHAVERLRLLCQATVDEAPVFRKAAGRLMDWLKARENVWSPVLG